ncbi:hypothetical protein OG225_16610 [Nocardia sp. NBC_01377]|uniref:hypothetical protein n=1 Tax=Nocardia sp. NBC_01377 TaxID=2903595 RepID=UPI00324F3B0D
MDLAVADADAEQEPVGVSVGDPVVRGGDLVGVGGPRVDHARRDHHPGGRLEEAFGQCEIGGR